MTRTSARADSCLVKPKAWPLHDLTLKVLRLSSQADFYQSFGFRLREKSERHAVLDAGEDVRLTLRQLAHGRPRLPGSAGLFHYALLLPDRAALGSFLRFVARSSFRFAGAADHLVSEALYFSDPENNGIEVYADRPRELWQWSRSGVQMATLALNLNEISDLPGQDWEGFPSGTRLGHMHLTVGDLDREQAFYESLNLRMTSDWGPFRFLSWDGYHHHVALNLLEGRNASPIQPEVSGLESFSIDRSSLKEEQQDPIGIRLLPRRFAAAPAS